MRVSLTKNSQFVFNKFLRKYKQCLQKFSITDRISLEDLIKILTFLGYVDQYINEQTQQLCHTIAFLLSENEDSVVTKGNLFQFLRIISDIQKYSVTEFVREVRTLSNDIAISKKKPLVIVRIGCFEQNGSWQCSAQDQVQVRKIFGSMNLKRISRQNIEAQNKLDSSIFQQETFNPKILNKSRQMAEQRYKKVSLSKSKVQDRLLLNQSLQKSRIEAEVNKSIEKEMKECYFKPKINDKRSITGNSLCKYIDSMNTSFETKDNKQNDKSFTNCGNMSMQTLDKSKASNIGDKLMMKGRQYEQNLQKIKDEYKQLNEFFEMKECTFQPKLCQKAYSHNNAHKSSMKNSQKQDSEETLQIRNVSKSIERMKQARKRRQFQNQVKERGYPSNVAWTKFITNYKKQFAPQVKTPILCIDLKIMNETKNIQVFEGQLLKEISEKICVENSVPHQFWSKVENLLRCSIQRCHQVKIAQNKIHLNR